ncbi:KinB-signaling pathway activation protein [Paenibacillus gansuensis]|uniref:KinB-signaling pathway activation protein n=1 Tax=Paenibacillus gansuensis TaxID=306542 RepID=A0ABW5PM69_9BACL
MNLKKWFYLFWTTLAVGAVSGVATGLFLQLTDQEFGFLEVSEVGFNVLTMLLGGLMFSAISQMGFFAYLTLNYIGKGMFRSYWNLVQLGIIIITLFELGYLRYIYAEDNAPLVSFFVLPVVLGAGAVLVALWKVRMTNSAAFVPTLLWMAAGTVLVSIPGLQQNNYATTLFITVPVFCCNAWQILKLHSILKDKKS